jgi:hypothetical protein
MVGCNFTEIGTAGDQVVRGRPNPPGDDQPSDHPSFLQRQRALIRQRQLLPALDTDAGQEGAGDRGHRVPGKHAGCDQVGSVGSNLIFDVCSGCRSAHLAAPSRRRTWASIASAARRYSASNQPFARCR